MAQTGMHISRDGELPVATQGNEAWSAAQRHRVDVMIDSSPAAIFEISPQGRLVAANAAAAALMGFTEAQMRDRDLAELVSPRLVEGVRAAVDHVLAGDDGRTVEGPLWSRSGNKMWVRAALRSLRDDSGRVTGAVIAVLDVTQEHRWERKADHRRRRIEKLSGRIVEAVGAERRSIALGLHDDVGQTLAALKLQLNLALSAADVDEARVQGRRALELLDQAIAQTRSFTFELYPPILREMGLGPAVEWLTERMRQQHGGQWTFIGSDVDLSEERAATMYGIARELMRNVASHANASDVLTTLTTCDGMVTVSVYDNGRGFAGAGGREGLGLFGVSVQLQRLGGSLEIDTMSGGSTVRATMPISGIEERERVQR